MKYSELSSDAIVIITTMLKEVSVCRRLGGNTSSDIFGALHSSLNALGLPKGEEREQFLNSLDKE